MIKRFIIISIIMLGLVGAGFQIYKAGYNQGAVDGAEVVYRTIIFNN